MKVVKEALGVVDSWLRFEFQGRGTMHSHKLLWVKEKNKLKIAKLKDVVLQKYILEFLDENQKDL